MLLLIAQSVLIDRRDWAAFGVAVAAAPTWLVGGVGLAMGVAAMGFGWAGPRRVRPVVRTAVA